MKRDTDTTTGRRARRWRVPALLLTAAVVGTSLTAGIVATQADAAAPTTAAQLSLTGVSSSRYPTGGNIVWVQPGGQVEFSAAAVSVAANQGPVLGLLGNLLGGLAGLEASADLRSVGQGTPTLNTASGNSVTTGPLNRGVYPITWSMTKILKNILGGTSTSGVSLNGNQAKNLGIALNASNRYVGYIYVNSSPPPSGFSIQLPTISVAPSLPVVGQLPTVTVPGTTVTVPGVQVPGQTGGSSSAPTTGSGSSTPGATGSTAPGAKTSTSTNPYDYTAPGCTGPCAVVPRGGSGGGTVGGAYDVTLGDLNEPAAAGGNASSAGGVDASSGSGSDVSLAQAGAQDGANAQIAVDRAFAGTGAGGDSAPGLPTALTLVAIAALAGSSVLWFARRRLARG